MIQYFSFALIAVLMFVGQSFTSPSTQDEPPFSKEQLAEVQALIDEVGAKEIKALDGAKLYKQNCTSCHGRKGGLGIGGAANLKKSTIDNTHKVAMMYYGKGKMMSYKAGLNTAEMLAISEFLETLKS